MKKLFSILLGFVGALAFTITANADVNVVPKVGYQFETHNTNNKQVDTIGQFQKNHATYGVEVNVDVDTKTQVGLEYLRTDSNIDSFQVGLIGNRTLGDTPFYTTGGVGYYKLSGDVKNIETPYLNLGVGLKTPLTNMISLKTEVRGQYLTNQNQWIPTALVGFEFKASEIGKPYGK